MKIHKTVEMRRSNFRRKESKIGLHGFGNFLRWFNDEPVKKEAIRVPGITHWISLDAGSRGYLDPCPEIPQLLAKGPRVDGEVKTGKSSVMIGLEDP